jgi:hypothetical protein
MNQDQIDSIVRKVLAIAGGILSAHGLTAASTTINSTDVIQMVSGIAMCVVTFIASHQANATQPVNTTAVTVTPIVTTQTTTTPTPAPTVAPKA